MNTRISLNQRDPGHWDVYTETGRAFAIRGDARRGFFVRDERGGAPNGGKGPFETSAAAVGWATTLLMEMADAA